MENFIRYVLGVYLGIILTGISIIIKSDLTGPTEKQINYCQSLGYQTVVYYQGLYYCANKLEEVYEIKENE